MSHKIKDGIKKQVIMPSINWDYLKKQALMLKELEGKKVTENEVLRRMVKGQIEYETKANVIKPL